METGSSPESDRPKSPEELAVALGFVETTELLNLRTAIVLEYAIDRERAIQLKNQYRDRAWEVIDDLYPNPNQRPLADAQVGLGLMLATMKLYAGMITDYNSELDEVLEQAQEYGHARGDYTLAGQIERLYLPTDTN